MAMVDDLERHIAEREKRSPGFTALVDAAEHLLNSRGVGTMTPMGSPAIRRARYEDLFELPNNMVGEIVDGELHASPRPATPHAAAGVAISGELFGPFQRGRGGPGGWWIFYEPELHIHEDVLVPDYAGWRVERMPVRPRAPAIELVPDWVCEILSPSNTRWDRAVKLPLYARIGVPFAWLIDPDAQTLEVLRNESGHWLTIQTFAENALVRAEPFDAIELDLSALWLS